MTVADSSLPLQGALIAAMKADAGVAALVADRVYDVPKGTNGQPPLKPYVSLGPFQVLPEDADCSEGVSVVIQIDGWDDKGPGTTGAKKLGAAIARLLQNAELALGDGQRLVNMVVEQIQYLREPDGITAHAVITVRSQTEPLNP